MKKKPITEAERREIEALEVAAAEAHEIKIAKDAYANMWDQFAKDSKKSKSNAYANLKENLALLSSFLVPHIMTAKEHMALIAESELHIKGEDGRAQEDPRTLLASWLRGEIDLSRIPLEKVAVVQ